MPITIKQDKTTGLVTTQHGEHATIDNSNMITYRRPRDTGSGPETRPAPRKQRGPMETMALIRTSRGWNTTPKPAKNGTPITRTAQAGTGGKAVRAVPTGNNGHRVTGQRISGTRKLTAMRDRLAVAVHRHDTGRKPLSPQQMIAVNAATMRIRAALASPSHVAEVPPAAVDVAGTIRDGAVRKHMQGFRGR